MSNPIYYVYIYLNPLKPGKFTYGDFLSFPFEPFYVGKGYNDRWKVHLKSAQKLKENSEYKCNKHLCYTILKIQENNFEPIIIKLNINLKECKAFAYEKSYINSIGRSDLNLGPLTNHTKGGDGVSGYILTKEQRERRKGNIPWNKGKECEYLKGEKNPAKRPEVRKKISEKQKGKEGLAGELNPMFGKTHSEENKQAQSIRMKGRLAGSNNPAKRPEVRKKISESKKGILNPNYNKVGKDNPTFGAKNGQAKKVMVNGNVYGCIKDAIKNEGISRNVIKNNIKNNIFGFKFL